MATVTYGPNLRLELAVLLHGDYWPVLGNGIYGGYGHWIIYHWSKKNEKSPYYNEDTKESILGPVYETVPLLIKTRRISSAQTEAEKLVEAGIMDDKSVLYYIEYFIPVQLDDFIYEIDKNVGETPPERPYKVLQKLNVTRVEPVLGNEGRVEYNIVIAKDAGRSW